MVIVWFRYVRPVWWINRITIICRHIIGLIYQKICQFRSVHFTRVFIITIGSVLICLFFVILGCLITVFVVCDDPLLLTKHYQNKCGWCDYWFSLLWRDFQLYKNTDLCNDTWCDWYWCHMCFCNSTICKWSNACSPWPLAVGWR